MILVSPGPVTAYRMHTPKWAAALTSGAGAAAHGRRVNRPGTPALYIALEADTAICEYQQLSRMMPPGTLVSHMISMGPLIDFRGGYEPTRWPESWKEFYCNWRKLWFDQRIEPPSWRLADEALNAGAKGILFCSTLASGGVNLVIYCDLQDTGDTLQVYDPAGVLLPKNQLSWP